MDKQNIDYTYTNYIKNSIVQAAINYWSAALYILRLTKPLVLPADTCIKANIPTTYQYPGVEADLVIFVTTEHSTEDFISWGTACFLSEENNRPVAGQLHINLNAIKPHDSTLHEIQFSNILHQFAHILGFSETLFQFYINPITNQPIGYSNIVR